MAKKAKYKRTWSAWENSDANNCIELRAENEREALYEALEMLGWCVGYCDKRIDE